MLRTLDNYTMYVSTTGSGMTSSVVICPVPVVPSVPRAMNSHESSHVLSSTGGKLSPIASQILESVMDVHTMLHQMTRSTGARAFEP